MSIVAIITARGGSKRIPRKNIKDFLGKPMLSYPIAAALAAGFFDEVMVSTEDDEIADVAIACGAKVPFRRSMVAADDFTGTDDVLREVLGAYAARGIAFDEVCCIYPTAPLVTANVLRRGYEAFRAAAADELVSVVRFSYPPQRAYIIQEGRLQYKWADSGMIEARSQDLETLYHDAGQFYFMRTESLLAPDGREKVSVPFILEEMQAQDIDSLEDWYMAELKYRRLHDGMSP